MRGSPGQPCSQVPSPFDSRLPGAWDRARTSTRVSDLGRPPLLPLSDIEGRSGPRLLRKLLLPPFLARSLIDGLWTRPVPPQAVQRASASHR